MNGTSSARTRSGPRASAIAGRLRVAVTRRLMSSALRCSISIAICCVFKVVCFAHKQRRRKLNFVYRHLTTEVEKGFLLFFTGTGARKRGGHPAAAVPTPVRDTQRFIVQGLRGRQIGKSAG